MSLAMRSTSFHNAILPTVEISGRRYLGNKTRLLPFIKKVVNSEIGNIRSFADIFAGTGSVASLFQNKQIICNDILYCNHVCHVAWFGSEFADRQKLSDYLLRYNEPDCSLDGYMANTFSDTFFSKKVCQKIDYIREDIKKEFGLGRINKREQFILLASLLYAMDRIANTCGHYDAWRKNGSLEKNLLLRMPDFNENSHPDNQFYNEDANGLVERIFPDLIYIDPPYNSRQYSDTYHLLENVARWEKPLVKGVARKMDRTQLKSLYCTTGAIEAFNELIGKINAEYILISYNNMGEKGNGRSNAKIDDMHIMQRLEQKGKVKVFTRKFPAFTTGKSNYQDIQERLFLCVCEK